MMLNKGSVATLIISAAIACSSIACRSPINIYKIDVRQGNEVSQAMIDKLHSGLTKAEVKNIMGSPAHISALNKNTWVYSYSFVPGSGKKEAENKKLILNFKDNKLHSYGGDWVIKKLPKK